MTTQAHTYKQDDALKVPPTCADHDEDCEGVKDKRACWLYAMERGMCPYLRALPPPPKETP